MKVEGVILSGVERKYTISTRSGDKHTRLQKARVAVL